MKKYFYLLSGVAATLFTSSCKKDYTCVCSDTYSYTGGVTVTDAPYEFTIKEANKRQAKANCVSTSQTYTYGSITYTYERNCSLK